MEKKKSELFSKWGDIATDLAVLIFKEKAFVLT